MASAHTQYTGELHRAFGGYRATWLPGVHLELGAVGTVEDGVFVPRGHLSAFGITFGTRRDPQPDDQFLYQSSEGVSIAFKAKGRTNEAFRYVTRAEAGIKIEFGRENAVVFSLRGSYEDRIDDQRGLAEKLLQLPKRNLPESYAIITHLVSAASGTILLSSAAESGLEIRADGTLGGLADLARVDAGLSIAYMKGMHTQLLASSGLTPLFRAVRIRKRWFGERRVEALGGISLADVVEDAEFPNAG